MDDFSKPNLRTGSRKIYRDSESLDLIYSVSPHSTFLCNLVEHAISVISSGAKAIVTWAPSHPELGYLAEVLRYANIIDGLSEDEKRDLRYDLEIEVKLGDWEFMSDKDRIRDLDKRLKGKKVMVLLGEDSPKRMDFSPCIELCPEYINYLQELLKPYLK